MGNVVSIRSQTRTKGKHPEDDAFLRKYLMGACDNTMSTTRSLYWNHFVPVIKETNEFEELIDIWKNTKSKTSGKPLSARTIGKIIDIYRAWFEERYGREATHTKKISRRINREAPQRVASCWTPEQASAALEAAYKHDRDVLYPRLLFVLHTGVRKEEMFALAKKACLFANNTVAICSDPDFDVTKSAKPRAIKMTQEVREMLMERCEGLNDDDLVFGKTQYLDRLKKVCRIAKIPFKRWHSMRHTYASALLNGGKDGDRKVALPVVSGILGHKNPAITAAIYWHCVAQDIDDSALPRRKE